MPLRLPLGELSQEHEFEIKLQEHEHKTVQEGVRQIGVPQDGQAPESKDIRQQDRTRRVIPSLPRPQTFHRQQSEKRERLLEVPQSPRRTSSAQRPRPTNTPAILPSSSAPELSTAARIQDQQTQNKDESDSEDDEEDEAEIRRQFEERWILNLSMHFRDRSNREKFFVTYAQTASKWRRLTISLDYRNAPPDSLEHELSELHFQRDKSFKIFDALRDSLPDIQFYNTVTNLKLETTPEDGQLHVHVREDTNEIIDFPAASFMDHVSCDRFTESQVAFHSHISGFVYKVRVGGRVLIKKEIPGPNSVDEFLYELNALNALQGSPNVIQLQGIVVDEETSTIRGLLISYASRGALMDVIYDNVDELSIELREKWAMQITRGLSQIHEAGFVQGDFTLSNIVIDEYDDAYIIDINRRGCPVGWEPPELVELIRNGQRISMLIGVKTDLYQLGMVLWALAECNDEPERNRPLPPIRSEMSSHLQRIVSVCLSRRPQERQSARTLLHDLTARRPRFVDEPIHMLAEKASAQHIRDKEDFDPNLAITIDEVRPFRDASHLESSTLAGQYDSRPGSSTYRLESSGSWGASRYRGRRLPTAGQASIFSIAATSATSMTPSEGSRCASEDGCDGEYRKDSHVETAASRVLAREGLDERSMRHQDSGFDETIIEELESKAVQPEQEAPRYNAAEASVDGTSDTPTV